MLKNENVTYIPKSLLLLSRDREPDRSDGSEFDFWLFVTMTRKMYDLAACEPFAQKLSLGTEMASDAYVVGLHGTVTLPTEISVSGAEMSC